MRKSSLGYGTRMTVIAAVCISSIQSVEAQQRFYVSDSSARERVTQYEELPEPKQHKLVPIVDVEALATPSTDATSQHRRQAIHVDPIRKETANLEGTSMDGTNSQSINIEPVDSEGFELRLEQLQLRLSSSRRSEQNRVRRIDEKIARLKRLFELRSKAELLAKKAKSKAEAEATKTADRREEPEDLPPVVPRPMEPKIPRKAATSVAKVPSTLETLVGEAVAVTDKAVDRIALANNLFATGELSLALKIYQSLELSELKSSDQVWVQYQMAGCHRRVGNAKQAQSIYRAVAASKVSPHWANRSRWWLGVMSKTDRIKQRQVNAVNTFVQLKEAADELLANIE